MAVNQKRRPARTAGKPVTKNDLKLLLCIVVFLGSVLLKYADIGVARQLRQQAAGILRGGADVSQVMEVVGHVTDGDAVQEVFSGKGRELLQEVFSPAGTVPKEDAAPTDQDKNAAQQTDAEADPAPDYVEAGGFAEDLEDREQTLFPKTVDETAYVMNFEHVQPVLATLTSTFGQRTHPITGKTSFHYGLDLAAPEGTPIDSLADGTVRETGDGSYGNYIIVDHADGFSTLYAHCSKLLAKKGEEVKAGQKIAEVGATGNATGNHLHLEVWRNGKALNPLYYVTY
ncbi:MAG: M23 family metallopeptidase [Intestinibacillus sp.]